jgi:hypothetical protein
MGGKKRLVLLGALAALVAALIPTGMAIGSHEGSPAPAGEPSVVLLTLGNQDEVTWSGNTQPITSKTNRCLSVQFASSPDLLDVSPIGGDLGLVKDGLGVKSVSDGTGEPCGRIEADDDEAISVALGSDLDGYLMSAIDVDLELKFNAVVHVHFLHDGDEVTDPVPFNPMAGSDDGPDSRDGDNYRFFHRPLDGEDQLFFDEVVFEAVEGAFSLEGGADLADSSEDTAFGVLDPSSKSSQFEIFQTFAGEITCGDDVSIDDEDVPGVHGEVTMHAMEFDPDGTEPLAWYTTDCLLKLYNDGVGPGHLLFLPFLEDTSGRYTIRITLENQPIDSDGDGQITTLVMQYNADGDLTPLEAVEECRAQPVLSGEGYDEFWTQDDVGLLPDDETACYFSVASQPTGVDEDSGETVGTEVWDIYFEDDPAFSFG